MIEVCMEGSDLLVPPEPSWRNSAKSCISQRQCQDGSESAQPLVPSRGPSPATKAFDSWSDNRKWRYIFCASRAWGRLRSTDPFGRGSESRYSKWHRNRALFNRRAPFAHSEWIWRFWIHEDTSLHIRSRHVSLLTCDIQILATVRHLVFRFIF